MKMYSLYPAFKHASLICALVLRISVSKNLRSLLRRTCTLIVSILFSLLKQIAKPVYKRDFFKLEFTHIEHSHTDT